MSIQIISCVKPKPDWWTPSECSQREIVPMFFDKILTPVMFKGPAKVRSIHTSPEADPGLI